MLLCEPVSAGVCSHEGFCWRAGAAWGKGRLILDFVEPWFLERVCREVGRGRYALFVYEVDIVITCFGANAGWYAQAAECV